MGGGSPSNVTQTTQVKLPSWAEPYAKTGLANVSELSQQPYTPYPYQTIAGMTPEHEAALQGITSRALAGSPVMGQAQGTLYDTLGGSYLYPGSNPYLSATYDRAAQDMIRNWQQGTAPQINAMANRAGAFGGSAQNLLMGEATRGLGENLSNLATDLFSKNYEAERQKQMQAMFFAPQMAQADYQDMQALLGVGDVRQQYEQSLLNDLQQRWTQQLQWPYTQEQFMASLFPAFVGGQGTTTSSGTNPYAVSPASKIMGGAMSGIGTGLLASSVLGLSNPISALIGAGMFLPSLFG